MEEIREIRVPSREIREIRVPSRGIGEIRDSLKEIRDYAIERFPLRVFLPAAMLIALASGAGPLSDPGAWAKNIAFALLLVAQFRVWDDLADRTRDAIDHPNRVLVRSQRVNLFACLTGALAAVNVFLTAGNVRACAILVGLNAVLAVHYALRGSSRNLAGSLLILAKYPAFVLILASGYGTIPVLSAIAIFAGACAFDALDTVARRRGDAVDTADVPTERVPCYLCGRTDSQHFIDAQDDLTGKPGTFRFVTCSDCGLVYQNPRVTLDRIGEYYDDQYIAHRKKQRWGFLTTLVERGMNKLDRDKDRIVSRYVRLTEASQVLDVGCAVGTFLQRLKQRYGASVTGVDFKDLSSSPTLSGVEFHCSLFYDAQLAADRFDLVTMWHFLEHDYHPPRSLDTARRVLKPGGTLVIEVPRLDSRTFRWFGDRWPGLQAPQHTVLFDRGHLLQMVNRAGFEVVDYLPYGAFPAYFYLATGVAFRRLKGRGLNFDRAIYPYFAGQVVLLPFLLFERRLNLAMQTVVCKKRA
jgi:SAM-dependent methyltransferase